MEYYIHNLNPIALDLGFLAIRWYSLAYIIGFILGLRIMKNLIGYGNNHHLSANHIDQFLFYCVLGVIIGGRLGHVLFYYPEYYLNHPIEILHVWKGGMSFHGGFLGVIAAAYIFTKNHHNVKASNILDLCACVAPIGLFFGRIANFINGELWGRPSDVAWAVIFPNAGNMLPRHPSQLYEALSEGLILFIIIYALARYARILHKPYLASSLFLIGYALGRIMGEFFRAEEILVGALIGGISYGQLLSLPMLLFGIGFLLFSLMKKR